MNPNRLLPRLAWAAAALAAAGCAQSPGDVQGNPTYIVSTTPAAAYVSVSPASAASAAGAAAAAPATPPVAAPASIGLLDVIERPAERALMLGLRAYDDARYGDAEFQLNFALSSGLGSVKDRAAAYKTLAFVYCTSRREQQCETAFRAARQADPYFTLNKSEMGHPVWGPVYRRALQSF